MKTLPTRCAIALVVVAWGCGPATSPSLPEAASSTAAGTTGASTGTDGGTGGSGCEPELAFPTDSDPPPAVGPTCVDFVDGRDLPIVPVTIRNVGRRSIVLGSVGPCDAYAFEAIQLDGSGVYPPPKRTLQPPSPVPSCESTMACEPAGACDPGNVFLNAWLEPGGSYQVPWPALYVPAELTPGCEGGTCTADPCVVRTGVADGSYRLEVLAFDGGDCLEYGSPCNCEPDEDGLCWVDADAPEDRIARLAWEFTLPAPCDGLVFELK